MKTSAQWCRVDTSYFTRNRETRGGRERLILSNSGPKDLPTALMMMMVMMIYGDDDGLLSFHCNLLVLVKLDCIAAWNINLPRDLERPC